jgi:probable phosphoglycerate mutase
VGFGPYVSTVPFAVKVFTELTIYTDGASRNNPGEAGGVSIGESGRPVGEIALYLGTTTNNIAEFTPAIIGS